MRAGTKLLSRLTGSTLGGPCKSVPVVRLAVAALAAILMAASSVGSADTYSLRASLYYSAVQGDYPSGKTAKFRNAGGKVLATGSREFLKAASIEGTAELANGTVLNFDRIVGGEVRWRRVNTRYGLDARGCALVPFRSAAVDPKVVPLGSRLLIAETRGIRIPGGGIHDGIWIATDTGQSIGGRRIDLFTGRGKGSMTVVERVGIDYLAPLHVKVVDYDSNCP